MSDFNRVYVHPSYGNTFMTAYTPFWATCMSFAILSFGIMSRQDHPDRQWMNSGWFAAISFGIGMFVTLILNKLIMRR